MNPHNKQIVSELASQPVIPFKESIIFSSEQSATIPNDIDTLSKPQSLIVYKEKDLLSNLQIVNSSKYIDSKLQISSSSGSDVPISTPQLEITNSNQDVSSSEFQTVTSSIGSSIPENQSTNNQVDQSPKKNLKIGNFFI